MKLLNQGSEHSALLTTLGQGLVTTHFSGGRGKAMKTSAWVPVITDMTLIKHGLKKQL